MGSTVHGALSKTANFERFFDFFSVELLGKNSHKGHRGGEGHGERGEVI